MTIGEFILAAVFLSPILFGPVIVVSLALAMIIRGSYGIIRQFIRSIKS
jgi:hypothetical protein